MTGSTWRDCNGRGGNLLILAPPLVIEENDLANASALVDRWLAAHASPSTQGD